MAWVAIVVVVLVLAIMAIGRNQARFGARRAVTEALDVGDLEARRVLADGRVERVAWHEVTRVEVVHARRGPHAAAGGVVMLAGDADHGCLVPFDRIGDSHLLERLERLPGFPVGTFVRALEDPDGGDVVCWTAPGPTAT